MRKKTAMTPIAFIVTEEIPERFATLYPSTLYETFTLEEGLKSDVKNTPAIYYISNILVSLKYQKSKYKLFVIYNPNPKRLQMALFADADKLILQVKNRQDLTKLKKFKDAFYSADAIYWEFQDFELGAAINENCKQIVSGVVNQKTIKDLKKQANNLYEAIELLQRELTMNFYNEFKFK